jgi:septal ring factor EnvC (AmiA/AmiB activator)
MINFLLFHILLMFQATTGTPAAAAAPAVSPAPDSELTKFLYAVLLAAATAAITYFLTRKKNQADIDKLIAETIRTYVQTINEIQETNQKLFDKIKILREENDKEREEAEQVETMLETAKKDLEKCLEEKKPCAEIDDVLNRTVEAFQEIETYLHGITDAAPLLDEIKVLSEKIAETKKK